MAEVNWYDWIVPALMTYWMFEAACMAIKEYREGEI